MVIVDWMIPVEIVPRGNAVGIMGPQSPSVVRGVESETVATFSKTIQIRIRRKIGTKAKILRLKYQGGTRCIKQNLAVRLPVHSKRKWRRDIGELKFVVT
jgi:hypothetical protein